jgi:hypothetical protein
MLFYSFCKLYCLVLFLRTYLLPPNFSPFTCSFPIVFFYLMFSPYLLLSYFYLQTCSHLIVFFIFVVLFKLVPPLLFSSYLSPPYCILQSCSLTFVFFSYLLHPYCSLYNRYLPIVFFILVPSFLYSSSLLSSFYLFSSHLFPLFSFFFILASSLLYSSYLFSSCLFPLHFTYISLLLPSKLFPPHPFHNHKPCSIPPCLSEPHQQPTAKLSNPHTCQQPHATENQHQWLLYLRRTEGHSQRA